MGTPCWDLTVIYGSVDDPKIARDVGTLKESTRSFRTAHRGKLTETLEGSLGGYAGLMAAADRISAFLELTESTNLSNPHLLKKTGAIRRQLDEIRTELEFYVREIAGLPRGTVKKFCRVGDSMAARHAHWIERMRRASRKNVPSSPTGSSHHPSPAEVSLHRETVMFANSDPGSDTRSKILRSLNDRLRGEWSDEAAKRVWRLMRDADLPNRRKKDGIGDRTAENLTRSVRASAPKILGELFRLKADLINKKTLEWSDRNFFLPDGLGEPIPFDRAMGLVSRSLERIDPELAKIARQASEGKRINGKPNPGSNGSSFNRTLFMPDGKAISFPLVNFHGFRRNLWTLAHELGHAVNGVLSGTAQGVLLFRGPNHLNETFSKISEGILTETLLGDAESSGRERDALALTVNWICHLADSVFLQVVNDDFGNRVGKLARQPSGERLGELWTETVSEIYGPDGRHFLYQGTESLWSVSHYLFRPGRSLGYAFGGLLAAMLLDSRRRLGPNGGRMFVELFSTGGSTTTKRMLKPFGLNPESKGFWDMALTVAFRRPLERAKRLAAAVGTIPF